MKKVLLAMLVIGLVAGVASADITKLFKLSGTTTVVYGTPRANMPATGYLAIDEFDNVYVVWYWTQNGTRWVAPYNVAMKTSRIGAVGQILEIWDTFWKDFYTPDLATWLGDSYAYWDLAGSGTGIGLVPSSMKGVGDNGYYNDILGVDTSWGYHTCSASSYKTLTDVTATAQGAADAIIAELIAKGYTVWDDGTGWSVYNL